MGFSPESSGRMPSGTPVQTESGTQKRLPQGRLLLLQVESVVQTVAGPHDASPCCPGLAVQITAGGSPEPADATFGNACAARPDGNVTILVAHEMAQKGSPPPLHALREAAFVQGTRQKHGIAHMQCLPLNTAAFRRPAEEGRERRFHAGPCEGPAIAYQRAVHSKLCQQPGFRGSVERKGGALHADNGCGLHIGCHPQKHQQSGQQKDRSHPVQHDAAPCLFRLPTVYAEGYRMGYPVTWKMNIRFHAS